MKDEPQPSDDKDDHKSLLSQQIGQRSHVHFTVPALTGEPVAALLPGFSHASSINRNCDVSIKCLIDGKWNMEIVCNAAVIGAYMRRWQIIKDEIMGADMLAPTGDIDQDAYTKKQCTPCSFPSSPHISLIIHRLEVEIMSMKKNQEHCLYHENAKIAEGSALMALDRPINPDMMVGTCLHSFPSLQSMGRLIYLYFNFRDAAATADRVI